MAEDGPSKQGVWNNYEVDGDKLVRKNEWSPKLGAGYRMANHKDRKTCGKTGYTEFKTSSEESKPSKDDSEEQKGSGKEDSADEGSSGKENKEEE